MLVNYHVFAAQGAKFIAQEARHVVLTGRGGRLLLVVGIRLRAHLHIAHEALNDI
jgi:hypothetical protein